MDLEKIEEEWKDNKLIGRENWFSVEMGLYTYLTIQYDNNIWADMYVFAHP